MAKSENGETAGAERERDRKRWEREEERAATAPGKSSSHLSDRSALLSCLSHLSTCFTSSISASLTRVLVDLISIVRDESSPFFALTSTATGLPSGRRVP